MANHFSRLIFDIIPKLLQLNESFLDEQLMSVKVLPWHADIINYLTIRQFSWHWTK